MVHRFGLASAAMALFAVSIQAAACAQTYEVVQERNGLVNTFARMRAGSPTTIAYFGGSITAGAGASDSAKTSWRALTTAWFRRQYPHTTIDEVNASIGGTGSDFGAFRLQRDVLARKPDLVFVEFAVNDYGTPVTVVNRAMEGIVRHIRSVDPTTEICFIYTLAQGMLPDYQQGKLPATVFQHDVIAAHYHISAINVGAAAAAEINSGKLAWADFSKDVCHPTDAGYAMYADTITAFLAQQILHISRQPIPYRLVPPTQQNAWANGLLTPAAALNASLRGWKIAPAAGGFPEMLVCSDASAEPLEFKYKGDTVGICYVLGPDTGNLDYKIDEADWHALKPFDTFAVQGQRVQYRILADSLSPGVHTLYVRPRSDKDDRSKGTYSRMAYFMANELP